MTNHPNRSSLPAILAACEADRIEAGTRRDGCGVAHIRPVLNVLDALAKTCRDLSSPRFLRIAGERDKARLTLMFCEVHDKAARGELPGADYDAALAASRAAAEKFTAAASA
jgi:hypothetical protein